MMLAAVFLTSLSSIAFEILLARIFSISQWNHLSFMVISIALFGLAASGTFLGILHEKRDPAHAPPGSTLVTPWVIPLYAASVVLSFIFTNRLPLDYFKLPVQPVQAVYLSAVFISLALPFFFAGTIVSTAYISLPRRTGLVYVASMCGSAAGALLPMALLTQFDEGRLVVMAAAVSLPGVFVWPEKPLSAGAARQGKTLKRMSVTYVPAAALLAAAVALALWNPTVLQVVPSDYKALSQMLQMPETKIVDTFNGMRGRIDRVQSPYLRFFPGLSLNYDGTLPRQFAVLKDGDEQLVCYEPQQAGLAFSRHTLSYAGYAIHGSRKRVLIVQKGGGSAVACALAAATPRITVIETHPRFAEIVSRHYGVRTIVGSPRSFLAGTAERYDLIHLENWGTSLPGTSALSQNHMFTIQAVAAYLDHLEADGLMVISRRLILPPSNLVRLCGAVAEALRTLRIENPARHVVILRNWDTFTLLASRRPIQHVQSVVEFAAAHGFDMVWPGGPDASLVNRYSRFEKPFHYLAVKSLMDAYRHSSQNKYYAACGLDVAPQTDNRPFPDKFFQWSTASLIHKMTGGRLYTLLMSGEVVVGAVFFQALLVSALLLLTPRIILGPWRTALPFSRAVYFLAIGAGFMLVEIFFINAYTMIYEDPVVSFAVVLAAVLVFSSVGGALSQYAGPKALRWAPGLLCPLLAAIALSKDAFLEWMLSLPAPACWAVSLAAVLPAGLLLGIPFPLAMRFSLDLPAHRAYAWAVNGCTSVLASVVAAQLSIGFGFASLLWSAAACYAAAFLAVKNVSVY